MSKLFEAKNLFLTYPQWKDPELSDQELVAHNTYLDRC